MSDLNVAIKDYGVAQFIAALVNTGYDSNASDFTNSFYHYLGKTKQNQHVFAIGMIDTEPVGDEEEEYLLTKLYIEVNSDGLICAEWQSMPDATQVTAHGAEMYFDALEMMSTFQSQQ